VVVIRGEGGEGSVLAPIYNKARRTREGMENPFFTPRVIQNILMVETNRKEKNR
jgi:hypothetical protein